MKNRFRFRAYEKSTNTMIYDVQESYDSYQESFTWFGYEKNFDLMQCTGIKDIKGKLIYEGDILKVVNGSINGKVFPREITVKWCENCWNIPKWEYDRTHYLEIVGNIYPDAKSSYWDDYGLDPLTEEELYEILTEDL